MGSDSWFCFVPRMYHAVSAQRCCVYHIMTSAAGQGIKRKCDAHNNRFVTAHNPMANNPMVAFIYEDELVFRLRSSLGLLATRHRRQNPCGVKRPLRKQRVVISPQARSPQNSKSGSL